MAQAQEKALETLDDIKDSRRMQTLLAPVMMALTSEARRKIEAKIGEFLRDVRNVLDLSSSYQPAPPPSMSTSQPQPHLSIPPPQQTLTNIGRRNINTAKADDEKKDELRGKP